MAKGTKGEAGIVGPDTTIVVIASETLTTIWVGAAAILILAIIAASILVYEAKNR